MAYCDRCERYFQNNNDLLKHKMNSWSHFFCDNCDNEFTTWNSLEQHYSNSPRHHYCSDHRLVRSGHDRSFAHSYIYHFLQNFHSPESLRQHYIQSGDHSYCKLCSILCSDFDDLLEHGEEYHIVCGSCDRFFQAEQSLASHIAASHYYCIDCNRFFNTQSNLDQHLRSSAHKPRTFLCVGRGCYKQFISISALVMHAESGACCAGLTRKQVDDFVVRADRKHRIITNPNRLLTDASGTCWIPPDEEYQATSRSWNGSGYECFLCGNEFRTLTGLNRHLSSPRHAADIYRCPMIACGMEFSTLSALIQHAEWGSCGVGRNQQVKSVLNGMPNNMKRIAL